MLLYADEYNEVLLVIISGITLLLVLAGAVIFSQLHYQKKKIVHAQEITEMERQYSDTLLKAKLEIQEQTFNTISQEIHDNVGQILSLVKVQLHIMEEKETWEKNMISEVKENINKALKDLRDIAKSLSSQRIMLYSLPQIVLQELQHIQQTLPLQTTLLLEGTEEPLDEQKKLIIFRMVQECFQNILKHASAANINVVFYYSPGQLQIQITDDGIGFNTQTVLQSNTGLGLSNIINRAGLIGGSASINSHLHKGTTIILNIPLWSKPII